MDHAGRIQSCHAIVCRPYPTPLNLPASASRHPVPTLPGFQPVYPMPLQPKLVCSNQNTHSTSPIPCHKPAPHASRDIAAPRAGQNGCSSNKHVDPTDIADRFHCAQAARSGDKPTRIDYNDVSWRNPTQPEPPRQARVFPTSSMQSPTPAPPQSNTRPHDLSQ